MCSEDPMGPDCMLCQQMSGCNELFNLCAGFGGAPPPPFPGDGACSSEQDVMNMQATWEAHNQCLTTTADEPGCEAIDSCLLAAQTGVSMECGGCFENRACCAKMNCADAGCLSDPEAEACSICMDTMGCNADFELCTGLSKPPPMLNGACGNEADAEKMMEAFMLAPTCEAENAGSVADGNCEPVALCIQGQVGLSVECTDCFAQLPCCIAEACPMCTTDPETEACMQCKEMSGCDIAFDMCVGLPPMGN